MSLSSILALSRLAAAKRSLAVPRRAMLMPGRNLCIGCPPGRQPTNFEDAVMMSLITLGLFSIPVVVTYNVSSYGKD